MRRGLPIEGLGTNGLAINDDTGTVLMGDLYGGCGDFCYGPDPR